MKNKDLPWIWTRDGRSNRADPNSLFPKFGATHDERLRTFINEYAQETLDPESTYGVYERAYRQAGILASEPQNPSRQSDTPLADR